MGDVYICKNCGREFRDIATMTANSCSRHPDGRGPHVPYEGGEKQKYTCKFCGREYRDIGTMTANSCSRHPDGKGPHSPAR